MNDSGFLIWKYEGQKEATRSYLSNERKILSTQNPISNENILQGQGKTRQIQYLCLLLWRSQNYNIVYCDFKLEEILKAIMNGKDKVKGSNVFTFYLKCQNQWTAISYTYNIILRATTKKRYAKGHTQKYYRYIKIKFWKKFK